MINLLPNPFFLSIQIYMGVSNKTNVAMFITITVWFTGTTHASATPNTRITLLEIKKAFRDENNILDDWNNSTQYCHWKGVICHHTTNNVITLNLTGLNLGGKISDTIVNLKDLRSLDLSYNNLSGEIPTSLYQIDGLEYITLRENNFSGTLSSDLCKPKGFWSLDVANNRITGNIPHSIGNCTGLRTLDLSGNQFTGEIPSSIGFLHMGSMFLQNNQLTGRVPFTIGFIRSLTFLDLSSNLIRGIIPLSFGNLTNIKNMYLQNNKLTGAIPRELGNLTLLKDLSLNDNKLTGVIPIEFGKLTHLFKLNVANNQLEGPIPETLSLSIVLNTLNLHGNKLNGTIPAVLGKLKDLTILNLSSNNIKGPIPTELGLNQNLDRLDLSNNRINGSIPSNLGNLEHLFTLDLSKNGLVGRIPVELGKLTVMVHMDLSSNTFSGPIPMELSYLQQLLSLNLSHNNLTGYIPRSFSRFFPDSFAENPELRSSWDNPPSHHSHSPKRAILGISFGSLAFILTILAGVLCWKTFKPKESTNTPELIIINNTGLCLTYKRLMKATENLSETYIIGHGASCMVYKCMIKNCKPLAIKKITNDFNEQLFRREMELLGQLDGPNVVKLQAYVFTPAGNLLVYDLMENGCLHDFLIDERKRQQLTWTIRYKISLGAARGLEFVHQKRTINRDVKSANILLDKDFNAYIADFGLAKTISASRSQFSTENVFGTPGYTDPEYQTSYRSENPTVVHHGSFYVSKKVDVYSYGRVLMEILIGRDIVDCAELVKRIESDEEINIRDIVDGAIWYSNDDYRNAEAVLGVAKSCIKPGNERPNMVQVRMRLEGLTP